MSLERGWRLTPPVSVAIHLISLGTLDDEPECVLAGKSSLNAWLHIQRHVTHEASGQVSQSIKVH